MDQAIRNKLRAVVTRCRKLLEDAVAQELQGKFGLYAVKKDAVKQEDEARMAHLSDEERAARHDILDHFGHIQARGFKPREALEQLVREIAFTHLNRFCAYKMMEARQVHLGDQKFREAVSRSVSSNGVKFYLADHPDDERLYATGHQDLAYRHFLDWLGGLLSEEIGVLFSPHDSANRLYPPQRVLDEVLALVNDEALADIWAQDETIGWIYQYFTPKELRDQARKESQAPRNSYELAFRNQFFTPRYVVEFLTDNTLGRIWYEMRKGDTKLKDQCRYLVRRPNEVFLAEGEQPPQDAAEVKDDLPQEELLKLPVHIPHRPKKDPRELKILDPACGSGHFLLYCFDLLLTIYEEAYADAELGPALQAKYKTLDELRREVPRLILAHNLHGIDIDLRATQIAALALWLRCQRAYQEMGLKKDRPAIKRSNLVCAEPMPGEAPMLAEFVGQLEPKLLGQLVEVVFDKMKLAGEAGSLLKIEEEIRDAVAEARREWLTKPVVVQASLFDRIKPVARQERFDFSGITDAQFFEQAEAKVVDALRDSAEKAHNGTQFRRRLFANDAVQGFAFVDLCHRRFDVVLMNPPFGIACKPSKQLIERAYPRSKTDVYAAFVERGLGLLLDGGLVGAITSRSGFFLTSFAKWREDVLLKGACPTVFGDLGSGVLDTALVETAAYCLRRAHRATRSLFFNLRRGNAKAEALTSFIHEIVRGSAPRVNVVDVDPASFCAIPGSPFAYWVSERIRRLFTDLPRLESNGRNAQKGAYTNDDFRFLRLWWEVAPALTARSREETLSDKRWVMLAKGGAYSTYYSDWEMVIDWAQDGEALKQFLSEYRGSRGWGYQWSAALNGYSYYFRPGLTWARRTQRGFNVRALPSGCIIGDKGPSLFIEDNSSEMLLFFVGVMNSACFRFLLGLQTSFGSFEVGVIEQTPVPPNAGGDSESSLIEAARLSIQEKQRFGIVDETSHIFNAPAIVAHANARSLADAMGAFFRIQTESNHRLNQLQRRIDECSLALFNIDKRDRIAIEDGLCDQSVSDAASGSASDSDEEHDSEQDTQDSIVPVTACISYSIGAALGRWDVRSAVGEPKRKCLPNPFAPLPVCSPATLQGLDGLPENGSPAEYPLQVCWNGIIVDDPDNPDDITRQVREVLEVIWKSRAEAIEKEACDILGVTDLRDYFRKPAKGGFWDDHISRYSKSRRKAPIYWLLQSSKKNYALWLYYHRLDKDLLFKALVNYVEPKIRLEENRLEALRTQKAAAGSSGREAKRLGKEVERQEDFLSELHDFEDKLRRAANLHLEPDLNDGVVLNIAPLWELVPWKEAKKYWEELLDGQYEWSSIGKQLRAKGIVQEKGGGG